MLRQCRIWQWISDFLVYLHVRIYGYIKTLVVNVAVAVTHFFCVVWRLFGRLLSAMCR